MLELPDQGALLQRQLQSTHVRDIKPLIVFLIRCPHNHFLLLVVYLQAVNILRPLQVPDSPLKTLSSVFPNEDRL